MLLIKNGRVLDPKSGLDRVLDVLLDGKKAAKIAENIEHATLVIVPGEGHGSYIEHSDKLYPLLYSFLNK